MKKLLIIPTISLVLGLMVGPAFAISFKFDFQHLDETPDPNGTEGLLLREHTVKIDIYLTDWEGLPNVSSVDYYFSWDPGALDVIDVCFVEAENWTVVPHDYIAPGVFFLGVIDASVPEGGEGVPGPDIFLHTIELRGINVPQWYIDIKATLDDPDGENDGVISDVDKNFYENGEVVEAQGKIHSICREHSFECSEDNPCVSWRAGYICPDDITIANAQNSFELIAEGPFCIGDTIDVKHNYVASYEVALPMVSESLCDSECFNRYFDDLLHYNNIPDCFYQCIEEDDTGYCDRLEDECDIIDAEVTATAQAYNLCYDEYGGTAYFYEHCGLTFEEDIYIKVREDAMWDCDGNVMNNPPPQLPSTNIGMGGVPVTLPLNLTAGNTYDICAEVGLEKTLVGQVEIATSGCPDFNCTIQIPYNPFKVGQGHVPSLEVALETNDYGFYDISLEHSVGLPQSLQLRSEEPVNIPGEPGVGTIWLDAVNPQPEDGQNYWANVRIIAEKQGVGVSCYSTLNYVIEALSANENCEWDDDFSLEGTVYGGAAKLGLAPDAPYDVYVMNQATWNGVNLTSPDHQTTFTTDSNGDMECGTVIWGSAQTDPGSLPAYFDIVIDVNDDQQFNVNDNDVIDSFKICSGTDGDGRCDDEDNCPDTPNGPALGTCTIGTIGDTCTSPGPNVSECGTGGYCSMDQEDTMPPDGNGCGDACECEGDFEPDGDVDGTDAVAFKGDFFRKDCAELTPCNGDFECDGDVDGTDAVKFKADFFRKDCPSCGGWPCGY